MTRDKGTNKLVPPEWPRRDARVRSRKIQGRDNALLVDKYHTRARPAHCARGSCSGGGAVPTAGKDFPLFFVDFLRGVRDRGRLSRRLVNK